MMLTTKGRYAVMALVDIAANSNGRPVKLIDISLRQDIALAYLQQIFQRLKRFHLVRAVKGPGGGYMLAGPAENIRISYIIEAADEPIKMTRCGRRPKKEKYFNGCAGGGKCLTHDLWSGLEEQIEEYLRSVTLADVCAGKTSSSGPRSGNRGSVPAYACASARPENDGREMAAL